MVKIYLLLQAIIIAWMSALSLSMMKLMSEDEKTEFEDIFKRMGKEKLSEQKQFARKVSSITSIMYIPYCIVSIIYFYGNPIPLLASFLLTAVVMFDYLDGIKRIKKAETITEALGINEISKVIGLAQLFLVAAQVGFLV